MLSRLPPVILILTFVSLGPLDSICDAIGMTVGGCDETLAIFRRCYLPSRDRDDPGEGAPKTANFARLVARCSSKNIQKCAFFCIFFDSPTIPQKS